MNTAEWIQRIDRIMSCIEGKPPEFTVPDSFINAIHGQTTGETRQFLNALCKGGMNYLEIGTYRGASLLTAAYGNTGRFIGMDNFSIFPEGGECKKDLINNLKVNRESPMFLNAQVAFHELDEKDAIHEVYPRSIDVFFYDGHHGAENTSDAIIRYLPVLKSPCVLLVDDYDWGPPCLGVNHVKQMLPGLGWKIAKAWEHTCHVPPVNSHNGIYVAVLERT